jgi:tetratricopeptide (TPR) repeat protein
MHLYRLRMGETDATRGVILAATGAARRLTGKRVPAGALFERADSLLKGTGQRLSAMHRADRELIDSLIGEGNLVQLADRLQAAGIHSETAVLHLLRSAQALLATNPEGTALVYDAAAEVAASLHRSPQELVLSLRAHAYKGRANALRILQRLDEATICLSRAAESFMAANFCMEEAGHVDYLRATIFLELEHWEDALSAARSAMSCFKHIGDTRRAAKAEILEAIILFEQGDIDAAHAKWIRLTGVLAALRVREDLARVWLNLGNCEIRRNRPDDAHRWLTRASTAFRKLGNAAELARTRWNIGSYVVTFFPEDGKRALRIWTTAYRGFLALRIWLDAGCVGLDMLDTMIDIGTADDELTFHACHIADTLARAGLGDGMVQALDQLRRITRHHDRLRVVRLVRTALRDSKANCNDIAVDTALGEVG